MYDLLFSFVLQFSFYRVKLDYTNLLGANMVQKSAKEEEIKDKGSKYRIYIPVYMELHIWEQM